MRKRKRLIKSLLLFPAVLVLLWVVFGPITYITYLIVGPDLAYWALVVGNSLGMIGWITLHPAMEKYNKRWPEVKDENISVREAVVLTSLIGAIGFYAMSVGAINPELHQPWLWLGVVILGITLVLDALIVMKRMYPK